MVVGEGMRCFTRYFVAMEAMLETKSVDSVRYRRQIEAGCI